MATITNKTRQPVDTVNRRLKMVIEIDGVPFKKTARNVQTTDAAELDAIMDTVAENMRRGVELAARDQATEELQGIGNWSALPEGPEKQRIAQKAVRDVVDYVREGKLLQSDGRTRPDAFEKFARTRSIKSKIWDELGYLGNHAARASYLALAGPGAGTEYGTLNAYFNDLGNAAVDWNNVRDFMATCDEPVLINTEMTV